MSARVLFWRESFRVTGACGAETAAARLRALLSTSARFSAEERILGRMTGMQFRIWKRTLLGGSADVVQLEGAIASQASGAVVEGTFSFKAATKVQFIGFLAIGLLFAASGALQRLAGSPTANDVLLFGCGIAVLTSAWIVGAYWMRDRQIAFLKSRIEAILEAEAP